MQPFLKGISVTTAAFAVIGGIAAAYVFGRHSATQNDITRALNAPTPAATYSVPATTYPIVVTPSPAAPATQKPSPMASPSPTPKPKKPAEYRNVDAGYIASKFGWTRIFDNGVKLDLSQYSEFNGIAGDFNGDKLEDLVFLGWKVDPGYNSISINGTALENTGIGYKPHPTKGYFGVGYPPYTKVFLSSFIVNDLNSDGSYEIIASYLTYPKDTPNWVRRMIYFFSFDETKIATTLDALKFNEEPLFWDTDGDGVDELIAINRLGDPIRVFTFGPDKYYIEIPNPVIGTRIMETVKGMAKTMTTPSLSTSEKEERITSAIKNDPYVGTISVSVIGGFDLDRYLKSHQQDVGLDLTLMYSNLVRGSFESAASSLASGDYAGAFAKGLVGLAIAEGAKSSVGNFISQSPAQIFTDPSGNRWQKTPNGEWTYLGPAK